MKHRVVVTGMSGLCPLGNEWSSVRRRLIAGESGITAIPEWAGIRGLRTRVGGRVTASESAPGLARDDGRELRRVELWATRAVQLALQEARLFDDPSLHDGRTGIAFGSTSGCPPATAAFLGAIVGGRSLLGLAPDAGLSFAADPIATSLARRFEMRGRVLATSSACASGSQALGFAVEAIRHGSQACMVAGGAEELHPANAAIFDLLGATSTRGDGAATPRPFDVDRDGLVVAEGAGAVVLEDRERALQREAPVHAEVVGFATNVDTGHRIQPEVEGMERVMRAALRDADLRPDDVDYVNAHATGTEAGDIAESQAVARVFGDRVPISSLKGALGHTLGACGALEAWITIHMMNEGWCAPTLHLVTPDPRCGALDFVRGECRAHPMRHVMSNTFALGGVNTSLIFRSVSAR